MDFSLEIHPDLLISRFALYSMKFPYGCDYSPHKARLWVLRAFLDPNMLDFGKEEMVLALVRSVVFLTIESL